MGISRHQQQSGALWAWGCVHLDRMHPHGAGLDLRELHCDQCFQNFFFRFSGCDMDMNEGVKTGTKYGIWFCCLCEYSMEGFSSGMYPTLVMYLHITIHKCFCSPGNIWQYLEHFWLLQLVTGRWLLLVTCGCRAQGYHWTSCNYRRASPPHNRELSGPKCQQCLGWETAIHYILGLYPLSGCEIWGIRKAKHFYVLFLCIKKNPSCSRKEQSVEFLKIHTV